MILSTYTKQPADTLDYDVDYTEWLDAGDTLISAVTSVDVVGLTVAAPMIVGSKVKLWVSSGTHGTTYKVTLTVTTEHGRIKQDEVRFKLKDY